MASDEQKLHLGSQDQPSPPCPLPASTDAWSMPDTTPPPHPRHWKWIFTDFSSVIFF